ncbi:hypothetical protein EMCRGX_G028867 [Ephydatia muelleri]
MIGDQNLEFDHGRAFWKPAAREVLTSTGSAVTPAGSAVPLPDEEDQHEEEEPDDNAHQQDIEEDKTHGEEYDSNDPLQLKLGDEIIQWTVLDDGVTVDQRYGFTWKQCAINWPSGLEVAEFRTALDCWNIMFPIQFFFGGDGVLRWTNESLPHNIHPFTEYEFLQCMGILLDVLPLSQYIAEPTKSKWRVGWMIGDQNLEFDHGRAFWKPAAREVLTSTGSAVTPAGSAVPLPDEEDQHEEEEPDDNAHQQDIEEDKTHGEEYDSNDPLQLKLGDEIIQWTVLDDGVTVDQRLHGSSVQSIGQVVWK